MDYHSFIKVALNLKALHFMLLSLNLVQVSAG